MTLSSNDHFSIPPKSLFIERCRKNSGKNSKREILESNVTRDLKLFDRRPRATRLYWLHQEGSSARADKPSIIGIAFSSSRLRSNGGFIGKQKNKEIYRKRRKKRKEERREGKRRKKKKKRMQNASQPASLRFRSSTIYLRNSKQLLLAQQGKNRNCKKIDETNRW